MTLLDGLRVVDLSTEIAGPYCTKLFADAGADVVKIEPATGDPLRRWGSGALFEFLNSSKRSVLSGADALVDAADLVVASDSTAATDLRALHPSLVVVTITPFGCGGPWAGRPATEFTLQAWCGSIASRGVPESPPLQVGGRLGEYLAGTYAAVGGLAAVIGARRHGHGDHVDVSILETMVLTMGAVKARLRGLQRASTPAREIDIPSIEPTADGYVVLTANSAQQFADLLILIEHPELLEEEAWRLRQVRFARRDEFRAMVREFTTAHTTEEVLAAAALLRVPAGPVRNGATVTLFDQFVQRQVFVPGPTGRFVQPRVPYRISGDAPRTFSTPPRVGEHTERVVWSPRPSQSLHRQAEGLPLTGIRVVDCTAFVAGPTATHLLACLGADVIKVESVQRPDLMRYMSPVKQPPDDQWYEWGPFFHILNNTKRGITLDLTSRDGAAAFRRLLAAADVLIENYSPRVLEQFGFGWDTVSTVNPSIAMVRMPAFGLDGPWRDRTGFAHTMEAITGIAWMTGWRDGEPTLARGPCDPLAGAHATFATLQLLLGRVEGCLGKLAEVPMVEVALNATAEQVVEYGVTGGILHRDGNRGPGAAPQGVYACAGNEQWLALAVVTDDQWLRLVAVMGRPGWAQDGALATEAGRRAAHDAIDDRMSEWTSTRDAVELAEVLAAADIPAAVVVAPSDVLDNVQLRSRNFCEILHHPVVGACEVPTLPFRLARVPRWTRSPAPALGEHNDEILGDLGVSPAVRASLRANQVIGERVLGA